jgi:hypothetical protein
MTTETNIPTDLSILEEELCEKLKSRLKEIKLPSNYADRFKRYMQINIVAGTAAAVSAIITLGIIYRTLVKADPEINLYAVIVLFCVLQAAVIVNSWWVAIFYQENKIDEVRLKYLKTLTLSDIVISELYEARRHIVEKDAKISNMATCLEAEREANCERNK